MERRKNEMLTMGNATLVKRYIRLLDGAVSAEDVEEMRRIEEEMQDRGFLRFSPETLSYVITYQINED